MSGGSLVFIHSVFLVESGRTVCVDKDEDNEDVDAPLLRKPEPEPETTDANLIQHVNEENAESERHDEPDRK